MKSCRVSGAQVAGCPNPVLLPPPPPPPHPFPQAVALLQSWQLLKWFAINVDWVHPKLVPIPIGVNLQAAPDGFPSPSTRDLCRRNRQHIPHGPTRPPRPTSN